MLPARISQAHWDSQILEFHQFWITPLAELFIKGNSHFINFILKHLPHPTQRHLTGKKTQQLDVGRSGINSETEKGLFLVCDKSSMLATFWP